MKVAFAGFQHGHAMALFRIVSAMAPEVEVVGAFEGDPEARRVAEARVGVRFTHDDFDAMLAEIECDAVLIGSRFSDRGDMVIKALEHGRHVFSDKPLCTKLEEWRRIVSIATMRRLRIGCMLDLREARPFRTLKKIVASGALGDIHGIYIGGQHPLSRGARPAWYFEQGVQGEPSMIWRCMPLI